MASAGVYDTKALQGSKRTLVVLMFEGEIGLLLGWS